MSRRPRAMADRSTSPASTSHASTSHAGRRPPALGGRGNSEILYGMHTVEAALQNPRRRILRLLATANAARRLGPLSASAGIEAEIVAPRDLDRLADPGAVHQGVLVEARPLE